MLHVDAYMRRVWRYVAENVEGALGFLRFAVVAERPGILFSTMGNTSLCACAGCC